MLKAEIRSYRKYCKYKAEILDRLDELWYELTGVKGIRYDKEPTAFNPTITEERRHSLMDKIDYYQSELHRVDAQIRFIDSILDRMDKEESELIRYVLIDGHTLIEAGERYFVTNTAISKRIDTILRKVLNTTFNH